MRGYLVTIPEEEKTYGIDIQSLTQWHAGLTLYFTAQPSFILSQISLFEQGVMSLDPQTVKLWSSMIPEYAQKPEFQAFVDGLMKAFDTAYQQHQH
jgi:hypothetical protein